jgi:pyridoxal phosphate enzyme (YggS family)
VIGSLEELRDNLRAVRGRIDAAAKAVGRDGTEVAIVAVTKELPPRAVSWARAAGVADFGENYVNELVEKRAAAPDAQWHYVGALQSHTASKVADHADVVHSAVPGRALERLARRAVTRGRVVPVLVQIDEAGRQTGVPPEEAEGAVGVALELDGVTPVGLMSLPPAPSDPEDSRPYFARLRALRDDLRERHEDVTELSMGMSLDYEIAVEEGATIVRIGTALFGSRPGASSER